MLFKALRIFEEDGKFIRKIVERNINDLPEGEVVIKVKYSSLNYKDVLSCTGNRGVTRKYPHTPGVDAAGIIESSTVDTFTKGEEVIVTGYDLGMNTDGGFGEYIRVPSSWVVKKPKDLSLEEAVIYGTAGFTAALSVFELIREVKPEDGDILVIGGTGGVGSHSVKFLTKLGYNVYTTINNPQEEKFAMDLGAKGVLSREEIDDKSGKALLKQRWAGIIDTVGGNPLSTGIRTLKYGGTITSCGNIAGGDIPNANVYPFILRGVRFIGIDSVQCPMEKRVAVWEKLAMEWKGTNLESGITEVPLEEISQKVDDMLAGKIIGRVILKHN